MLYLDNGNLTVHSFEVDPETQILQTITIKGKNEDREEDYVTLTVNGNQGLTPQSLTKTIEENGTLTFKATDTDHYIYSITITTNVPQETVPTQSKTTVITQDGTYTITPDDGYNLSSVVVKSFVYPETETPSVTYTSNGTYTIEPEDEDSVIENATVVVNVPSDAKDEESLLVTYTSNGTYTIEPSDNDDTISDVTVTVNVPSDAKTEQTKTLTITENGTYTITPDDNKVISLATVVANVSSTATTTGSTTITSNGTTTLTPSSGYAFSSVEITTNVAATNTTVRTGYSGTVSSTYHDYNIICPDWPNNLDLDGTEKTSIIDYINTGSSASHSTYNATWIDYTTWSSSSDYNRSTAYITYDEDTNMIYWYCGQSSLGTSGVISKTVSASTFYELGSW